jgi:hypothetical protein
MKTHVLFSALALYLLAPSARGVRSPVQPDLQGPSAPDSAFDPDGPWAANQWIRLGDYEISGFVLRTIDYDPATGRSSPRSDTLAWVEVGRVDVQDSPLARCPHALVRPDTLALRCPRTSIGEVRVEGKFVGRVPAGLPDSAHAPDQPPGSLILRARVQVVRRGRVVYAAVHEFTQTEGD